MKIDDIYADVLHCILGSRNRKLTLIMKNGDEIVIIGRETVVKTYYIINGK